MTLMAANDCFGATFHFIFQRNTAVSQKKNNKLNSNSNLNYMYKHSAKRTGSIQRHYCSDMMVETRKNKT